MAYFAQHGVLCKCGLTFNECHTCTKPDETPTCPKSGKRMKFLCQLGSFSDIKSSYSNVEPTDGMAQYFEKLNFWCDEKFIHFRRTDSTDNVLYNAKHINA